MRLGERKPIILHVIARDALNALNVVAAAGKHADEVTPEDILHSSARKRAAWCFASRSNRFVISGAVVQG